MRRYSINSDWSFSKESIGTAECVTLPHVWDIRSSQNGDGGYVGPCAYTKQITLSADWKGKDIYLEVGAANSVAEVFVNGHPAGVHKGGYSLFRVNMTPWLDWEKENEIRIRVDNTPREDVYPIAADYTFFGGVYRDVNLIVADKTRFSLDDDGSDGIYATTGLSGESGFVKVECVVEEAADCRLWCQIFDQAGKLCADSAGDAKEGNITLSVANPMLWEGRGRACLYILVVKLMRDGRCLEERRVKFGFRTISLSAREGFLLNGNRLLLRGVARHQDREDRGWAVSRAEMEEDIGLIRELGANSVRLAHYQHAPYFYDLCDREGLVVWAEIPFISRLSHCPEAHDNAMQQLRELIKQNYNHPSICFWGIGNDLSMFGESEWVLDCAKSLNQLAKELDPGRITVCSQMMMLDSTSRFNQITDGVGYNIYYGWYIGECGDMDSWLTQMEETAKFPVAVSEYGADGILQYQNNSPTKGDYSEGYQAYYHEQMLDIIRRHDKVWATYVWNLFDFASVSRSEGGVRGRNTKGLVTYDRKTKKDAYYLYQAEWSSEPVIHIAGKRYQKRAESQTSIRVYSNAGEVVLFVNGMKIGPMCRSGHIFWMNGISLQEGKNEILVKTERGDFDDTILYGEKTDEPSYLYRHDTDKERRNTETEYRVRSGCYSVYDSLNDILLSEEARKAVEQEVQIVLLDHPMIPLIGDVSLENVARKSGGLISKETLNRVNAKLTGIRKDL